MSDANGLSTVLKLLGARGAVDAANGQDDLFGGETAPMPVDAPAKSGPQGGRPKGARNRSTDDWIKMFLAQHRAPLPVLGAIYSRSWQDLYDELQKAADKHRRWRETKDGGHWEVVAVSPLDVLKFQAACAQALLPYLHKQQPKALEIDQRQLGVVLLGDIGEEAAGSTIDDADGLPLPQPDTVKTQ